MTRCRNWTGRLLVPPGIASVVLVLAVAAAAAAPAAAARADGNGPHRYVTVMTQNMDEGTDFTPLFTATSVPAFEAAAVAVIEEVIASDIPARAQLMADEIAAAGPDMVALQEATVWTWQSATGPASADLLGDLESALAADSVTLTGTSAVDGLWPSDHAGVIAAIQIPS